MANIALICIYILAFAGLLISAHLHGKPRDENNFWVTFFSTAANLILIWWALGWTFW